MNVNFPTRPVYKFHSVRSMGQYTTYVMPTSKHHIIIFITKQFNPNPNPSSKKKKFFFKETFE